MENKVIITIGRQFGSGGRFIGRKLAEELNIPFYDSELLAKAAKESGLSEAVLDNYDERKDSFFSGVMPYSYGIDLSLGQKVFLAQFDAIKHIAAEGSCIIVGRCADYVLRENPNVASIYISAPLDYRKERVIKYYGVKENKARDTIIRMDKKRASYYNYYTDQKWGRARYYDLCIDASIGIDETAEVIKHFVKTKFHLNCDK